LAIQIGLIGAIVLWSMWIFHIRLLSAKALSRLGNDILDHNHCAKPSRFTLICSILLMGGFISLELVGVLGEIGLAPAEQIMGGSGAANCRNTRHPPPPLNGCPKLLSDRPIWPHQLFQRGLRDQQSMTVTAP
jgi:hypothetical protein